MPFNLARGRALLFRLPGQAKLTYCLVRDPRVPRTHKAVLAGALGLVLSPLDWPGWVPVVGQMDTLALSLVVLGTFVSTCPEDVVADNRRALKAKASAWDREVGVIGRRSRHSVFRLARSLGRPRLPGRAVGRLKRA